MAFDKDNNIENSLNHIKDTNINSNNQNITIGILNDPKVIEEHTHLKNVVELLFGKDYNSFLSEQKKTNTGLIIYLSKILKDKNIFEITQTLEEEITKREKLQNELEKAKKEATSQSLKEIIPQAEKALAEFKYEEYHEILAKFEENNQDIVKDIAKTYFLRATEYYDRLEYQNAIEFMRKAVVLDSENSLYLNEYGYYLDDLAQYDEAIEYYEKALAIDLKTFGEVHPNVAIRYNNLGSAYWKQSKYDKAIEYYNKALEIDLQNFGETHPQIAIYNNNLGTIYRAKDEYDKAIEYYNKALAIDLKTFGENHPKIAIRYNNLGEVFRKKGEYDKAIEYLNKALAIDLKTFSETHPNIAIRYNNLGLAYYSKKDYNKALEYYEKSLKIFRDVFKNETHPNIQTVKRNLEYAKESKKNQNSN